MSILLPFPFSSYHHKAVSYPAVPKAVGRILFPFNHLLLFFNQCDCCTLKYSGLLQLLLIGKGPRRVEIKEDEEWSGEECLESVLQEGSDDVKF